MLLYDKAGERNSLADEFCGIRLKNGSGHIDSKYVRLPGSVSTKPSREASTVKRVIPLLLLAACTVPPEEPEHPEVVAVRAAIQEVFDGMRTKDSAMVSARLAEGVLLHRAGERDGVPVLSASEAQGWLNSIAQEREEILDEQIWDIEIEVDGRLATAWMKFAFFLGGEFSHCGVNAMMLFKDTDGWKIFALADTSRRGEENCWMPPDHAGG